MNANFILKKFPFVISLVSLILFILLLILFSPSTSKSVLLLLFFILFDLVILFLHRNERRRELSKIKNVIRRIRLDEYKSSDEILLGNELHELQDEIKAMFSRTQNDILNLKRLEQVRTEFLGNVSHELRTPIFSIQGYLETLKDGALEDPKVNKTFLQKAIQHTLNLNTLLNDLIDISMIESGQMKMSFRYFNAHDFLKSIVTEFKPEADKKKILLELHSQNQKLELFGDKQRLRQVMSNLIMNALKYTEAGAIEVGVVEEIISAKIYVKDSGFGISETDLPRIFERFYRIDKDRSREMGGSGLGLAIVKHIIEAHSSVIEVVSQIGEGSEFSFRLKK